MAEIPLTMPAQFKRRAATASFIVAMYDFFCAHGPAVDYATEAVFGDLPEPPSHLDLDAVQDGRAIARTLAEAILNKYHVNWSTYEYQKEMGRNVLPEMEHEDQLMRSFPPLIDLREALRRIDGHLPVVSEPAVITDIAGNTLVWSLPGIIPERRQEDMAKATRCLEGQLTANIAPPSEPLAQVWRTGGPYFHRGEQWATGTTLLYPAGYAQGHTGRKFPPAPSVDTRTERAAEWMISFETAGGLLDGILAVVHPELYRQAQAVAEEAWSQFGTCRATLSNWPSTFSSVQVISNRATPYHRDTSGRMGWLELLLTLGTYGETGVLQLRNLGVSLPYSPGSVALLCSRQIIHGVPSVPNDRICYAFFMNKHLFKRFDVPLPGPHVLAIDDDDDDDDDDDLSDGTTPRTNSEEDADGSEDE